MKIQKRKSINIKLKRRVMSDAAQLGRCLQNIERIYSIASTEMGISGSSVKLEKVKFGTNKITVKGLATPLLLTKEVIEQKPDLIQDAKAVETSVLSKESNSLESLFGHVAKGMHKIKPKHLPAHVRDSLKYWLARNEVDWSK